MILQSRFARLTAIAGLALLGTIAFGIAMSRAGEPLTPNTILTFEFAFRRGNAMAIMETWSKGDGLAPARQSLAFDVGFIVLGYAPLLAALCVLFSRPPEEGSARPIGHWFALAAIAAGTLDLIENAALWGVLRAPTDPSEALTWLAGIAATIKFLLVVPAAIYALLGLGGALARVTPLVQWFLSYPLLLFPAVLLICIVWRVALVSFGIPDLFWDESALPQLAAGAGVGALLAHLGVMGFLLDTHRAAMGGYKYRGRWASRIAVQWIVPLLPTRGEAPVLLSAYLLRSSLPLLVFALASVVMAPGGVAPWWLPLGAVLFFLAYSAGSVWLADSVVTKKLWAPGPVRRQIDQVDKGYRNLHRLAYNLVILHLLIYLLLFVLYRGFDQGVYVGLAVCVLLAGVASAYGFLKYFFAGRTFGLLTGFVVAFVALNSLGGHRLPNLDYYRRTGVRAWARASPQPLLQPDEHLNAWKARRGGARPPLVVVAVDGGGIRAAVWATVVLNQLERDVPDFPYFVRIVTGASGGMVGMASYVGSLQAPGGPHRHLDLKGDPVDPDDLITRVATDSLGTVTRDLVFKDLPIPPFLHPRSDRGLALERAWEANTRILGQPFAALAEGEASGWRPSLVVSPLIVEDGRRLLISNLDLEGLSKVPVVPPPEYPSLQAIEYFRMIEEHPGPGPIDPKSGSIRLSTAARLNASFPYVSPAAELPTHPPRHTLDAGYYDEHGVELAGTWIWANRPWLKENTSGVLLVQVPDARARVGRQDAKENRQGWWAAGLIGVTGPIEALRTSGSAAADYRNDQLVRFLEESLDFDFETVVFEPDETAAERLPEGCDRPWLEKWLQDRKPFPEIALSWHLTSCEVRRLKLGVAGDENSQSCRDRRHLQDWWRKHWPPHQSAASIECPPRGSEGSP